MFGFSFLNMINKVIVGDHAHRFANQRIVKPDAWNTIEAVPQIPNTITQNNKYVKLTYLHMATNLCSFINLLLLTFKGL